jgi:hypothetical protein
MRILQSALVAALVSIAPCTIAASPTSVGIFFDVDATDCDASVPQWAEFYLYVAAILGTDIGGGGITSASLSLQGIDPAWSPTMIANPAASITLGGPLDAQIDVGFSTCQTSSPVLLFTVRCVMIPPLGPRLLRVARPFNPHWALAPMVSICVPPTFPYIQVPGGEAILNGGACTVGVEAGTWSSVKSMFR